MAKITTTFTFLADEHIWLPFLLLKRRNDKFRIGVFCEKALREALPAPHEDRDHALGPLWQNEQASTKARGFRCTPEVRPLLDYWSERLRLPARDIIVTAIRRKQERDGLIPKPARPAVR